MFGASRTLGSTQSLWTLDLGAWELLGSTWKWETGDRWLGTYAGRRKGWTADPPCRSPSFPQNPEAQVCELSVGSGGLGVQSTPLVTLSPRVPLPVPYWPRGPHPTCCILPSSVPPGTPSSPKLLLSLKFLLCGISKLSWISKERILMTLKCTLMSR